MSISSSYVLASTPRRPIPVIHVVEKIIITYILLSCIFNETKIKFLFFFWILTNNNETT